MQATQTDAHTHKNTCASVQGRQGDIFFRGTLAVIRTALHDERSEKYYVRDEAANVAISVTVKRCTLW